MISNTEILREWTEEDWIRAMAQVDLSTCSNLEYLHKLVTTVGPDIGAGFIVNFAYVNNTGSMVLVVKNHKYVVKVGPPFSLSEINDTICAELSLLVSAIKIGAWAALSNVCYAMKIMKGENDDKGDCTQESQNNYN